MHPYVFQTAAFSLRWENVAIIVGIAAGIWLAFRLAAPKGSAYQDMILDLALWLVPAGIIGARVWELLFTWQQYTEKPLQMLAIWNGGMSIQGSILGGLVATVVFARRRQVRLWDLADILAPGVILGQAIGRFGCLMSGDAFGLPISEVPWFPARLGLVHSPESPAGMIFGDTRLIPAEAIEGLLCFAILAILLYRPGRAVVGRTVLLYAILYSAVRFGLEFLRADSLYVGPLKVAQVLSAVVVVGCTALLLARYYPKANNTKEAAG